MHWKIPALPRMKKARTSKLKLKVILIIFFDIKGIVMTQWVPESQIVNQSCYLKVLVTLWERVVRNSQSYGKTSASGHTVHCLGHDSISGPAIGPFFSMFIWKNFFLILANFWNVEKGFSYKKKSKKIKAVLRETELKTEFPIYFRQNEKKNH